MRARLVVFPVKGRNWCFSRSVDSSSSFDSSAAHTPASVTELWKKISFKSSHARSNAELLVDFVSNKMNKSWMGLEKAPEGSFKNKLHGLGLRLLARVKPSEIFLKSITKEVSNVEITFPSSLNGRLVRRRLRHIALSGSIIHRKYLYGSVTLLPLTSAFTVLPLPNIPFFWVLFRTYSHWRALQGSEKLLELVSDSSVTQESDYDEHEEGKKNKPSSCLWVLQPSTQLKELVQSGEEHDAGLTKCAISGICKTYGLNLNDVLKYRDLV